MKLSIASYLTPLDDDGEALSLLEAAHLQGVQSEQEEDDSEDDTPKVRRTRVRPRKVRYV